MTDTTTTTADRDAGIATMTDMTNCPYCSGTGSNPPRFTCEVCGGEGQTSDEGLASLWTRRTRKVRRLDAEMRENAFATAADFEAADRAADRES